MKFRHLYSIWLFVTILAIGLASARTAHACSPFGEPPNVEEKVEEADIIVVAQVIGTDGFFSNRAALLVEKYLKGSGPDILFSEGYGASGGDCKNAVSLWLRGTFYLDGDAGRDEILRASYSYPYEAVDYTNHETTSAIIQITGQDSYPTRSPFEMHIRAFGMSLVGFVPYFLIFTFFILLPILGVAAAYFLLRFIYRRLITFVRSKSSLLAIVILLAGLAAMTDNASACGINTNLKPPSETYYIDQADLIVIGQAIGGGFTPYSTTILVEKYLKGSGPDILFTKGYGTGIAACGRPEILWSRKIYYYRADERATDPHSAWQDWDYAGQEAAVPATIAEISNYTGELTEPTPSPLNIRFATFLVFFNTYELRHISLYCLFPSGIVLAIFLVRRALLRRKRLNLAMQL
jgi:hypothetical protein